MRQRVMGHSRLLSAGTPLRRLVTVLWTLGAIGVSACSSGESSGAATTQATTTEMDVPDPQFKADAGSSTLDAKVGDATTAGDGGQTDGGKSDVAAVDAGKTDSGKSDSGKTDGGKTDAQHADSEDGEDAQTPADAASCVSGQACKLSADCAKSTCENAACKAGCCVVTAKDCDDKAACSADLCDPTTGACSHVVDAGSCLIGGKCYVDGDSDAVNPCKVCDSAQNDSGWTLKPNCCTSDAQCPSSGPCDQATCDLTTNQCTSQFVAGCCIDDAGCNDQNPCTTDSCDQASGKCSNSAIACPQPSLCQTATCDPASAACKAQLIDGWCFIDGACVAQGAKNPNNPCQSCQPAQGTSSWSAAAGQPCNDGNACTVGDACTITGMCAGNALAGCCVQDSDCGVASNPCATLTCDVTKGTCVSQLKAGCCSSGICCDLGTLQPKPAQTPCGPTGQLEYQCNGQQVQKRELQAGCTGQGAEACSTAAQHLVPGPWQTIQTCGASATCVNPGGGKPPTCESTGPSGTCGGVCGGKSPNGTCYCDSVCTAAGDCCSDFLATCGCSSGECCDVTKKYPKAKGTTCGSQTSQFQCTGTGSKTVQKRTGQPTCDGKNTCSTAEADVQWNAWSTVKTCTATQNCVASSGTCTTAPSGSCKGRCGTAGTESCFCDPLCKQIGDCCLDYDQVGCAGIDACGSSASGTCKGVCGKQGTGGACWCDTACETIGDCCKDWSVCGCK